MPSRDAVYGALATRQQQWDNLIWQVPILSFTAQAFLFTITLGRDTTQWGRIIASILSLLITFLSLTLMKSHRLAEVTDSEWLAEMEKSEGDKSLIIHGMAIRERRKKGDTRAGRLDRWVPTLYGYKTWIVGMGLFGVAGLTMTGISVFWPSLLSK